MFFKVNGIVVVFLCWWSSYYIKRWYAINFNVRRFNVYIEKLPFDLWNVKMISTRNWTGLGKYLRLQLNFDFPILWLNWFLSLSTNLSANMSIILNKQKHLSCFWVSHGVTHKAFSYWTYYIEPCLLNTWHNQ